MKSIFALLLISISQSALAATTYDCLFFIGSGDPAAPNKTAFDFSTDHPFFFLYRAPQSFEAPDGLMKWNSKTNEISLSNINFEGETIRTTAMKLPSAAPYPNTVELKLEDDGMAEPSLKLECSLRS